jgi:hypothetical protein
VDAAIVTDDPRLPDAQLGHFRHHRIKSYLEGSPGLVRARTMPTVNETVRRSERAARALVAPVGSRADHDPFAPTGRATAAVMEAGADLGLAEITAQYTLPAGSPSGP